MPTFNLLPDLGEIWYKVSGGTAVVRLLESATRKAIIFFIRVNEIKFAHVP